jgi:hypothetical protein
MTLREDERSNTMKTRVVLAFATAAILLGWIIARPGFHQAKRTTPPDAPAPPPSSDVVTSEEPPLIPAARLVEVDRMARRFVSSQRRKSAARATSAVADTNSLSQPVQKSGGKEVTDPVARVALIYVGADPEAEAYWFDAINDPSLSANERQDLIEDLNEEGFADPHHPTIDDLPLIVSRLELIEELAWDAMDEVNSDAFAEAHKDLTRMAQIAQEDSE